MLNDDVTIISGDCVTKKGNEKWDGNALPRNGNALRPDSITATDDEYGHDEHAATIIKKPRKHSDNE